MEEVGVDVRIILILISKKGHERMWTGSSGGLS
jgi:hypothetical protein